LAAKLRRDAGDSRGGLPVPGHSSLAVTTSSLRRVVSRVLNLATRLVALVLNGCRPCWVAGGEWAAGWGI